MIKRAAQFELLDMRYEQATLEDIFLTYYRKEGTGRRATMWLRNLFTKTLRDLRGQILGWGIGAGLLGWMVVFLYPSFKDQTAALMDMLKGYPAALTGFFGDFTKLSTYPGWLNIEFLQLWPAHPGHLCRRRRHRPGSRRRGKGHARPAAVAPDPPLAGGDRQVRRLCRCHRADHGPDRPLFRQRLGDDRRDLTIWAG